MKLGKVLFLTLIAAVVMFAAPRPSMADTGKEDEICWMKKLGRGALNMISSPIDIPRTIHIQTNAKGGGYGWTVGLVEGAGQTLVRFFTGAIDVVTCPFDFPDPEKGPLVQPVYPWENWDAESL